MSGSDSDFSELSDHSDQEFLEVKGQNPLLKILRLPQLHCEDDASDLGNTEDITKGQSTHGVLGELKKIQSSIQSVSDRVGTLEAQQKSILPPAAKKHRVESHMPNSWADRPVDEQLSDSENLPVFSEPGNSEQLVPSELSEAGKATVAAAFAGTMHNEERGKEIRDTDAEFAHIQAFIHDPIGPLITLLHNIENEGGVLRLDEAASAVLSSIRLLGNASAQVSRLRRKKLLKAGNPDIQDLAEEDIYSSAAPYLFGSEFEGRMNERAKSLKILAAAETPSTATSSSPSQTSNSHSPDADQLKEYSFR
uniref:Uncharacterized protein n=1 Tax=Amphimedon queenslandica TaxID=400682 RepID=A0A1X7VE25_AMPQE